MNSQRTFIVVFACGFFAANSGCPSRGFFGRYVFINSGSETIRDFTLSAGDNQKTWASTEPGQGWVTPNLGHLYTTLDVTWKDEFGETIRAQIDFTNAVRNRWKGDLIVELDETNALRWRLGPESWEGGAVFVD